MLDELLYIFSGLTILFFTSLIIIYIVYTIINGKRVKKQLELYNIMLPHFEEFSIRNPYQGKGKFYKAQLHTHTTNSDGKLSPEELVTEYKKQGFKYLAITDHDKITYCKSKKDSDIILITGEEMTYPRPIKPMGYHINRLFINKKSKFTGLQQNIDQTKVENGIIIINHPAFIGNLGTQRWLPAKLLKLKNFHFIEIANHHTSSEENILYWHLLLKHFGPDRHLWSVGGDDTHFPNEIGSNYIMVRVAKIDIKSLKMALNRGDFYPTQGPEVEFGVKDNIIYTSRIKSDINTTKILFIDSDNKIRKKVEAGKAEYEVCGDEGFVRIEVIDTRTQKRAWSQPFWLKRKGDT